MKAYRSAAAKANAEIAEFQILLTDQVVAAFSHAHDPGAGDNVEPVKSGRLSEWRRRTGLAAPVSSGGAEDQVGKRVITGIKRFSAIKGALLDRKFERAVQIAVRDAVTELENKDCFVLVDPAVAKIAAVVGQHLPEARRKASAATIERLVDVLIETQDPLAEVSARIDLHNAEARIRFMGTFPTLTAEEVSERAGSRAGNRHQMATRWRKEGKIFSIPWQGRERFPAFQFDAEGRPFPVVEQILGLLPKEMAGWEIGFWFVSTNGWLDGAAPCDRLSNREAVLKAAQMEGEAVIA